jgi:pSer/pThr/pTyr-binding forkhead associated (FHA) protein
MTTQSPVDSGPTIDPSAAEGITERVDVTARLDERVRRRATPSGPTQPGRYLEVDGPSETLLIPLVGEVMHIGRGLAADLRLDDASVSRRHAILVNRDSGTQVLDERSSNGTFVNGRRISQADLRNGDTLVLGRLLLRYIEI